MHTVHLTQATWDNVAANDAGKSWTGQEGDVGAAAVGLMFSVEDYTANLTWSEQKIIDSFFDSLIMGELGTD